MVKCHIDKTKDRVRVKATGKGEQISLEALAFIREIHRGMASQNPEAAAAFKLTIIAGVLDPETPVWETEE